MQSSFRHAVRGAVASRQCLMSSSTSNGGDVPSLTPLRHSDVTSVSRASALPPIGNFLLKSEPGLDSVSTFTNSAAIVTIGGDDDDDDDRMRPSDVKSHRRGTIIYSDEEEQSEVHLSIFWSAGKLGAAYYDSATCELHVLNDTVDVAPEFIILNKVIRSCKPTAVVTSAHQDERLIAKLRDIAGKRQDPSETSVTTADTEASDEGRPTGPRLNLEPTVYFDVGGARSRIVNLKLPGMPHSLSDTDRVIFMSSLINFDNLNMVRALGALLKYLDRKRINVELEDYSIKSPVMSIGTFSVKGLVSVDDDTYRALQIFQKEWHPSVYKMASGMKEGLSLFGIFNRCKSTIGSKEMQLWFLRPTRDADVLKERQMAIAFGSEPSNTDVVSSIQTNVKNVRNVSRILAAMSVGQCTTADWQTLYKSVYSASKIGEICRALPQSINIFNKISNTFTQELLDIASLINRIVDFDQSHVQNRFVVNYGVDEKLDQDKRNFNGLPNFMTTIASAELDQLDSTVEQCEVIYLPQLGYLLAIPLSRTMQETKEYTKPGLEFVFMSQTTAYYKSSKTKELDEHLGDIQNMISDHEIRIMLQLQNTILEHAAVLSDVTKYAAQLDCLMAMAAVAKEFNYVRPEMTNEDVIYIENGRHPLQELCVSTFVPNTTTNGGLFGSKIKLLTGPNACGKSVYLKQVALIVFMAHIGSFVPATSASIGNVDAIFTRIHTLESVSVGLSTFMIDLNQISFAMRLATKHSLVIVDEFGKGTSAVDGMALLASCLEHWASHPETCPHLFVATHIYGVLKILSDKINTVITCQTLETACGKDDLAYLYQLVEGRASCSYAHWVALQANIPRQIVDRGLDITKSVCQSMPIPAQNGQRHIQATQTTYSSYSKLVEDFLSVDLISEERAVAYLAESRNAEKEDAVVVRSAERLASFNTDTVHPNTPATPASLPPLES